MRKALMKLDAKIAQRKARTIARKNQREEEAKRAKTEEKRNHVEEVTSSDEDNVEEEHGKEEAKTEKTEEKRNHVEEEHGTLHLPARTSYIYLPARIP